MAGAAPGLSGLNASDPVQAGQQLALAAAVVKPEVERVALWLGPLLAVVWAIASGLGRSAVLKRLDPTLRLVPFTLILLQLLRMAALIAACVGWYRAIRWAADANLNSAPPNLVAWSAWVICLSLGIFVLWALLSWIFSIAPLLAMLEGTGVVASLAHSLRLGELTSKLVEVNLVLGIVQPGADCAGDGVLSHPAALHGGHDGHRALPLVGHGHLALSSRQRFFPGREVSRVCPILAPLPSQLLVRGNSAC